MTTATLPPAYQHAKDAAAKSDASNEGMPDHPMGQNPPVPYKTFPNIQNPHTYTHAAEAAAKSDADGAIPPVYLLPPSQQ